MYVIKNSGEKEPLNLNKVARACKRAGADNKTCDQITKLVKSKAYNGITTKEIYQIVFQELKKINTPCAAKYSLKQAIMSLGPSGFPFEKYLSELFQNYGYKTSTNNFVKGKCITHEIDVIIEKQNKKYMLEAKYHNEPGTVTGLHPAMYTYARFLDIKPGYQTKPFDGAYLITNTRCSPDAIGFAECYNLKIISWDYPKGESLRELIEKQKLYPITILQSIGRFEKEELSKAGILLIKDIAQTTPEKLYKLTKLDKKYLLSLIERAKQICL